MTTAAPPRSPEAVAEDAAVAVHDYARSVIAGVTVANRYVRIACERHLRDLEEGPARGLRFDATRAARAIRFFGFLRLAEGAFAGRPFDLRPWQAFIVGSLFGWYTRDADGEWESGRGPYPGIDHLRASRLGLAERRFPAATDRPLSRVRSKLCARSRTTPPSAAGSDPGRSCELGG